MQPATTVCSLVGVGVVSEFAGSVDAAGSVVVAVASRSTVGVARANAPGTVGAM